MDDHDYLEGEVWHVAVVGNRRCHRMNLSTSHVSYLDHSNYLNKTLEIQAKNDLMDYHLPKVVCDGFLVMTCEVRKYAVERDE